MWKAYEQVLAGCKVVAVPWEVVGNRHGKGPTSSRIENV
jgi:hypothetical protein